MHVGDVTNHLFTEFWRFYIVYLKLLLHNFQLSLHNTSIFIQNKMEVAHEAKKHLQQKFVEKSNSSPLAIVLDVIAGDSGDSDIFVQTHVWHYHRI